FVFYQAKFVAAGMRNNPTNKVAINAIVLVIAKGLNSFPSAPVITRIGKKLTIVVAIVVITAPLTSFVASKTTVEIGFGFFNNLFFSINSTEFSTKTIQISTILQMAMAIPESATILSSTPPNFIPIKTNKTA